MDASDDDFDLAKIDFSAKLADEVRRIDIQPENACGHYELACPVERNDERKVKVVLPVQDYYPAGSKVQLTFKLLNGNNHNIFCVSYPAKVVED